MGAEDAPLVVWLQGGPGGSSLFGLFSENGPFSADADLNLVPRNYSWTNEHNVIYFDNPVGTGYSFTKADEGYCTEETCVGAGLTNALLQFLTMFPELKSSELYITGESYAGKYVPAFAYTIHLYNNQTEDKVNLKGVAIGDGLIDPRSMMDYGDLAFNIGLINNNTRNIFIERQQQIYQLLDDKNYADAFKVWDSLLNGDLSDSTLFGNATGLTNYYNYISNGMPPGMDYFHQYVNQPKVRKAIHVGNLTFNDGSTVEKHLKEDMIQSVKPWLEELLDSGLYRVVLYGGQLDIIVGYPLTRNFVNTLAWPGADAFRQAPQKIWKLDGSVAGYVTEGTHFALVLVRSAGHMVPMDQPARAYDLIRRVTGVGSSAGANGEMFGDLLVALAGRLIHYDAVSNVNQ